MRTGGNLGHDAAVKPVDGDLGMYRHGKDFPASAQYGSRSLITGGFYCKQGLFTPEICFVIRL